MAKQSASASLLVVLALIVILPYVTFIAVHAPAGAGLEVATAPPPTADFIRVISDAQTAIERSRATSAALGEAAPLQPPHEPLAHLEQVSSTSLNAGETAAPVTTTMAVGAVAATLSSPRQQDLVLGLGTGITPENLAVFAGSLREANPTAALVLYLDLPLPSTHSEIVRRFNVTAVPFAVDLLEPDFLRKYHPSNYRWPLLYRYLRENGDTYRKVLLADVRDTAFQSDPFASFGEGFFAFNGVESRTIGECGWNGGWVKDCFGKSMLSKLSKKTIICSGISMGDFTSVKTYLELMTETMETPEFSQCERNGVDQGVHNVLVHTGKIPALIVHDQKSGWVANMQAGLHKIVRGERVVNQRGERVAVVHQYDRFKDLQAYYFKKYVFWEMPSEAETCKDFTVVRNAELFKKTCELKVTSGHSVSHCCVSCQRMSKCQAFSFAGSQCFLKSCTTSKQKILLKGVVSGFLTKPS